MKTNLPSNTPADTPNIPPQLAMHARWLLWRYEDRDGHPTKVPYIASGRRASVSKESDWSAIDAVTAVRNRYDGIGFVLGPPFVGIDLDDCLNPDGTVKDWAAPIIAMFDGTYCEVSPSGTGLKLFCLGKTTGGRKVKISDDPHTDDAIECYSSGRYFTVTGNRFGNAPTAIIDKQAEIDALIAQITSIEQQRRQRISGGAKGKMTIAMLPIGNSHKVSFVDPNTPTRHQDLASAKIRLQRDGVPEHEAEQMIRQQNQQFKKGPLEEQEMASIIHTTTTNQYPPVRDEWPEPLHPRAGLEPVPKLSEDMIPEPLRSFVVDISERVSVPIDMVAPPALAMLGTSIGRAIQIQPQRFNEWRTPPNLWSCIVAGAGWKKSPVLGEVMKPLSKCQRRFNEEHKQATADYNKELRGYERDKADCKKSGGDPGDPPIKPPLKRLYTQDATDAGLHMVMIDNPKGLMLQLDEAAKLWESLDLTGSEKVKGFFLSCWNGNAEHILDRAGRGLNLAATVCLSQIAACQPSLLRDYVRGMKGDGWLQRYALIVYPDLNERFVLNTRPSNQKARDKVDVMVSAFADLDVGKDDHAPARVLQLSTLKAQSLYEEWLVTHENYIRSNPDDLSEHVISSYAKQLSAFPQLCLLFELCGDPNATEIHAPAVELAEQWCDHYLRAHIHRVYALAHPGGVGAESLAAGIEQRKIAGPFTARDVQHKGWRGLTDKRDVQDALDALVDLGWIRPEPHNYGKLGNQSTTKYSINPRVFLKS